MFSQVKPEYVTNYSEAFGTKSGGKQQAKKHDDNIIMNLTMKTKKIEDKSPENTIYKTSYTNNWLEEKDTKNQRKTIE